MEGLSFIIGLVAGCAGAGFVVYRLERGRRQAAVDLALGEARTELALARERQAAAERQVQELRERARELEAVAETTGRTAEERCAQLREALARVEKEKAEGQARAEEQQKALEKELTVLEQARERLSEAFRAVASEALAQNNSAFLQLARETLATQLTEARGDMQQRQKAVEGLVQPITESLRRYETHIQEIERARQTAYGEIRSQVVTLAETHRRLQAETGNLVQALRAPVVRGRWGEIQLRRVVELAGMVEYCDFQQQESVATEQGRLRPDLVVRLPGGKTVVVDAKAPLKAYLDSLESPDEEARREKLREHARAIRAHIAALSQKAYWQQFQPTPEFVFLFLPGETFFSAALEQDPSLIEEGAGKNVILATPTTLIALLRAVAYGWRQEKIAENAQAISDRARELYARLATLGEHFIKLGRGLESAVENYNRAVATLESRVLVTARQFKELGAAEAGKELPAPDPVEKQVRALQAPEFTSENTTNGTPPPSGDTKY